MSTEIVLPEDPFSTYKQARDDAFTKVSDFGAYFIGILGRIESDALTREQAHISRLSAASQQLAILNGERNALLEQVDMLQRRLEIKTPDPESAEELTRVRAELDIVRMDVRRLTRELREATADLARVADERDRFSAQLSRLVDSEETEDLRRQLSELEGRLEDARAAGREAVAAAERAVTDAEEKAARRVAKARADSAAELEAAREDADRRIAEAQALASGNAADMAGLRADIGARDAEISGLRALAAQSAEGASALAVSTLHAMVLENPQLPASRALGLMAAALGIEAPQLPEETPAYEAPEAKDDLFDMPAALPPLTQPAPEIAPDLAYTFDTQPAPAFEMQSAPAHQMQPAPAAPVDPLGGFFDTPAAAQQAEWTPVPQNTPIGADFFESAAPAGAAQPEDAPLTADFFAKAPPVRAA